MLDQIFEVVKLLISSIGGIAIFLLISYLLFPERVEKLFIHLLKLLAYISEKHERKYIARHIEFSINNYGQKQSIGSENLFAYAIKVEWVNEENIESYLKNGVLIVKMKNHRNQSKNLAYAVKEFVPNSLIPKARRYVEKNLMNAIDFIISKDILTEDPRALSYFIEEYRLSVSTLPEDRIRHIDKYIRELEEIHSLGLLTGVLLSEYKKLVSLYPLEPQPEVYKETIKFKDSVYKLVSKERGVDVSLEWPNNYVKAALVPIAKSSTVELYGIEPHLKFIQKLLSEGINTFYIVAAGRINISFAKWAKTRAVKEFNLELLRETEYQTVFRGKKERYYICVLKLRE